MSPDAAATAAGTCPPGSPRPNGAMLLHHLGDMHPTEVRPYLKRMETEDIATVAAEAYEVIPEGRP